MGLLKTVLRKLGKDLGLVKKTESDKLLQAAKDRLPSRDEVVDQLSYNAFSSTYRILDDVIKDRENKNLPPPITSPIMLTRTRLQKILGRLEWEDKIECKRESELTTEEKNWARTSPRDEIRDNILFIRLKRKSRGSGKKPKKDHIPEGALQPII